MLENARQDIGHGEEDIAKDRMRDGGEIIIPHSNLKQGGAIR
jgi:hypothetical protein